MGSQYGLGKYSRFLPLSDVARANLLKTCPCRCLPLFAHLISHLVKRYYLVSLIVFIFSLSWSEEPSPAQSLIFVKLSSFYFILDSDRVRQIQTGVITNLIQPIVVELYTFNMYLVCGGEII